MSPRSALPVLVVAPSQNDAELLNSTLRNAGHAVRPIWAASMDDAEKSLKQQKPDLILCSTSVPAAPFKDVVRLRDMTLPNVPIIAIGKSLSPAIVAEIINTGARDLVSMDQVEHLQAVVSRELEVLHLARDFEQTSIKLHAYEQRINLVVKESKDAISYVHDGIMLSANPAFLELFGHKQSSEIEGTPILELFEGESQAALKDALRVASKGQHVGALTVKGRNAGSKKSFSTTLEFAKVEVDGEQAIAISIRSDQNAKEALAKKHQVQELALKVHAKAQEQQAKAQEQAGNLSQQVEAQAQQIEQLNQKLAASVQQLTTYRNLDLFTGLMNRTFFLETLTAALQKPAKDGALGLVIIKPDKFTAVAEKVGVLASDTIIKGLADMIRSLAAKEDRIARFGGTVFMALVVRPKIKDVADWADRIRTTASSRIFQASGKSTNMTVSLSYVQVDASRNNVEKLLEDAEQAHRTALQQGGNKVIGWTPPTVDAEGRVTDTEWQRRITEALKNHKFLLAFQPVASLTGEATDLHDVLVRMRGDKDEEIPPKDFLPAAERINMMTAIDRWILEASMSALQERLKQGRTSALFVRLSDQSLTDKNLLSWIEKLLAGAKGISPANLIFEIPEKSAEKYLTDTKSFAESVRKLKCRFALEHFGIGHDPLHTLELIKDVDFLKIDGSISAVLATDPKKHEMVKTLVKKAQDIGVKTVAERVEKPETMAVLYTLGIEFIQGNIVQEPEVVMSDTRAPK
ncbi:MAG TPA: GGDEF domain-containing response regulator [Gammaproteobacteria bacterium]|nr:GGDEF domain-containing response regulator [Gammaproteobacteria bacterium]